MTDFVELPSELAALNYCQMICGIIRGALEMVQLEITATVEKVTPHVGKEGCVFPLVVVSILLHAEFGPNYHEDAPHFIP